MHLQAIAQIAPLRRLGGYTGCSLREVQNAELHKVYYYLDIFSTIIWEVACDLIQGTCRLHTGMIHSDDRDTGNINLCQL